MFVAGAIIGSTVIGGVLANVTANRQAGALERGADAASRATIESARLQLAEIARQFDYQTSVLGPLIQQQYNAGAAYHQLLGIGGQPPSAAAGGAGAGGYRPPPGYGGTPGTPGAPAAYGGPGGGYGAPGGRRDPYGFQRPGGNYINPQPDGTGHVPTTYDQSGNVVADVPQQPGQPQYPGPGASNFVTGDRGQFVDPNIDPTRLADINTLPQQVQDTLLAGTPLEQDEAYTNIGGRLLAEGAAGTGVYGDEFRESPGYAFSVEEMDRSLDRRNSAGGNYGGRAIMEAQRRAKGLADQEFYRWGAGRERDLSRLGQAEAQDASRIDNAIYNWLQRKQGDVTRLDSAARQEDALMASDQTRGDQAYYNFLRALSGSAGFGNPAGAAVSASSAASGQASNAYANQGSNLASIAQNQGANLANVYGDQGANINNMIQGGIQNWLTYDYLNT
jgi:hypothetical protein